MADLQFIDQPSSDVVPMEEDALCLEDENDENLDGDARQPLAELSAKDYLLKYSKDEHQLNVRDFVSLPEAEKFVLVSHIDDFRFNGRSYELSEEKVAELKSDLQTDLLRHSVYTKNLVFEADVVKDKFSLPPLVPNMVDLKDEDGFLHWYDWLCCDKYYSLNPAFPMNGSSEYDLTLDADATCIHSPTLLVLKQTMQLHCAPNYDKFSRKIKHKYQDVLLHSCVNIEIGSIGLKWKVFAVFIDFERGSKCASSVIKAFYTKLIEGVKKSGQAGRTGFEKHTEEFLERGANRDQMAPIEPETLVNIMESLSSLEFNRKRVKVVFSFQYCGQKDGLRASKDVSNYINNIEATFDINGICDPEKKKFENVLFIQDMALVISPKHNSRNPLTVCWSPQFLQSFLNLKSSSLANLYHRNERHAEMEARHPEKPRCDIYPNLGIGTLQSAMASFTDTTASIYEMKAYFSGSAYWRRHQPYDLTSYCSAVLPYETLLMGSSVPVSDRRRIVREAEEKKRAFLKNNPETAKIEAALAKLEGMSYGARLEISFLNLSKYELMAKYNDLVKLGTEMIQTHCWLSSACMDRRIPLETMRLSPIQVVTTQSLVQLASFQAKLLNHIYKTLFLAAAEADGVKLESDLINALVIMEDMQQFLWSGSVKDLMHPTLFNHLHIVDNLFKYNRFYLPREVFGYNPEQPRLTKTSLPKLHAHFRRVVLDADDLESSGNDELATATQLAVTRRVFYRAFGGKQYENILKACHSLSATAQLLMPTTSSFFSPLYGSKSNVIAANILNAMLSEMLRYIGVQEDNQAGFFEAMRGSLPLQHSKIVRASQSSMDLDSLLEVVFCMGNNVLRSVLDTDFYELWQHSYKVVHELNEQWKWSSFATFRDKSPDSVAVLPTITRKDILNQMLILCHQYELRWFPVIGTDSLVLKRKTDQRYFMARIRIPFESTVLPIRGMINSKPLPHPVDMSFVYMLARMVAQEAGGPECRINEMVGHIMYHYTKIQGHQTKKLPVPRYSNLPKESLMECCLFERPDLTPVSRNRLFHIFINMMGNHY